LGQILIVLNRWDAAAVSGIPQWVASGIGQVAAEWAVLERPAIFGALLDVIAHGLRQLPHVTVPDPPRLIDLALLGTAIEQAFAPAGSFLRAFTASQAAATDATVEVSPVATAIAAFMEDRGGWDGTTTELWRQLQARDQTEARPTEMKGWPKDPISFGIALTKAVRPSARSVLKPLVIDRPAASERRWFICVALSKSHHSNGQPTLRRGRRGRRGWRAIVRWQK
jgi:hypothetical protein